MRRSRCAAALAAAFLSFTPGARSQPAPPEATAKADAAADGASGGTEWSVGPINFSGLIDGYYSANLNHPESRANQLRNFDVKANQFSLNMVKLTMEHTPDPLGFRVDLGFGRAFDIVHSSETGPEAFRYVEQAFMSYKPVAAGGLQVDFGKFVTSAGAEVIETHSNWSYSRSLLFALAIPYYHFGARATMPFKHGFSAGAQLVNGWNSVEDNNSGKTVGLTGGWTQPKFSWANTYYFGPERNGTNAGRRDLYDTTLLLTPNARTAMYINFDYGSDRNPVLPSARWVGVAGAARFAVTKSFALAPRVEWFNDADGFMTGTVQKLKEVTMTAEYKMAEGVLSRLEYRRDWSNTPFFDRGATPASFKNQDTFLVGFVAYFGPKR